MANPLVLAQLLTLLLNEIKGRKAEKTANILTELLTDVETIQGVRAKFDEAVTNNTGLTLTPEEVADIEEVFDDVDAVLRRLKLKK